MDGPRDSHTKWSKPDMWNHMISFVCRILKNDTNKLILKTELDSQS